MKNRLVTVCSACRRASCWNYIFLCEEYVTAGTIELPVSTLRDLDLEHPSYWEQP